MRLIASLTALLLLALGTLHADPAHAANQWESEIVAFENADKTSPPPKGAIVVTGSSTIRLWNTIKTDLAPLDIIPRGFGGSTADDLDYYLERIVLVYEPRAVVIYEGDNDISGGKSPQYIADRMAGILARISARLPNARVYVLAIKPSPARWTEWPNAQQANQLFAALCATDARYTYINAGSILLGSNGQPNPAYYQSDGLHLNGTGYSFWTSVIRPVLIAQQSVPLPADATAPTVPTGLTATAISSSRIDLRWNASSDSGVGLAGYQVRRGGIAVATTTATRFSDTGLTANTAYSYTVSAYDRVTPNRNESANSAAASASTPPATTTPAPTVTLTAAPNAITVGGTTLLTWSSTDATSCTASGGWSGAKGTSGSTSSAALNSGTTFTLACTGAGGTTTASATVTVSQPAPSINFSVNPATIVTGNTTQLSWTSAYASSCTASGGWSGSKPLSGNATSATLTATTTFTLTCNGEGGSSARSATVTVTAPPPTVTLTANPTNVGVGATTQLTWSSTDATSCTATGGWSGAKSVSGTVASAALSVDTTFTLTCSGSGGSASASATVTATPAPSVTLTASPTSLLSGQTTQLTWSSANATACTASGGWTGSKGVSGSAASAALTANTTFTLSCSGVGGSKSTSATVTVTPLPTVTLTASPASVANGASTQLAWNSTNATSCTASGGWNGSKATSGSATSGALAAPGTTTFTLSCTGPGGTASANAAVTVLPPVPTVTLTANPTTVANGTVTQLTWSATDSTSCTASGAWSGTKATSGNATSDALAANATFTLSCTGPGGSAGASANVTVLPPVPTVTLAANPSSVANGGTTQLSWNATNATSCTAGGGWTGSRATAGTETTPALTTAGTSTFTLTCTGPGGSGAGTANVTVAAATPPPSVSISASPASVSTGGSSQLTWTASNANSCSATGDWSGSKPASGSEQTSGLTQAATYNLSCTGAGGTSSATVTVKVSATTSPNDTVTVTASSGNGGGGGGGALGVTQLAMLLGLLWRRQRREGARARALAHADEAGCRTHAAPAALPVPATGL